MEALRNIENQQPVHGCRRCGEKFSSGQALGGHQTKHRVEDQEAAAAAAARAAAREAFSTRNEQPVVISSSQQQVREEEFENLHQEGPTGICLFCLKRAPLKLHFDRSRILASAIKKVRRGKLALKRGGSPFSERSLNSSMANARCSAGEAPGTNKKKAVSVEEESGGRGEVDLTLRLWPAGYN